MINQLNRDFKINAPDNKYEFSLDENLTVGDLKRAIWEKSGAHPLQQRLYSNRLLDNEVKLKDVDQKITLLWRLKPAAVSEYVQGGKTIFRTYMTEVPQPDGPSKFVPRFVFLRN